jgi:hypothetical protein
MKPNGRLREAWNSLTGERISLPAYDNFSISGSSEIPALIDLAQHYRVLASGQWNAEDPPLILLTTDGRRFAQDCLCQVSGNLRPKPVSTSAWDVEAGPNIRNVPEFGKPCDEVRDDVGVFPNPWTKEVIEVPNAGRARFWIEFEFARFLYPRPERNFDILSPSIVERAEACFETRFAQGCRYW